MKMNEIFYPKELIYALTGKTCQCTTESGTRAYLRNYHIPLHVYDPKTKELDQSKCYVTVLFSAEHNPSLTIPKLVAIGTRHRRRISEFCLNSCNA